MDCGLDVPLRSHPIDSPWILLFYNRILWKNLLNMWCLSMAGFYLVLEWGGFIWYCYCYGSFSVLEFVELQLKRMFRTHTHIQTRTLWFNMPGSAFGMTCLTQWNLWQYKYTIIDCVLEEILYCTLILINREEEQAKRNEWA